jgi:hypothetical protein
MPKVATRERVCNDITYYCIGRYSHLGKKDMVSCWLAINPIDYRSDTSVSGDPARSGNSSQAFPFL